METRILKVSGDDIDFQPKQGGTHGFDDPNMSMAEPTATNIKEAAKLLRQGEALSFPTETVYGLGANALQDDAVAKIYAAKNRPPDNPLILHISSLAMLRSLLGEASIPALYEPLIKKFWPGPLTILMPLKRETSNISRLCTSGQDTFAVRMPQHPIALALINETGAPLAAPSANTSTRPSPTTAGHVYHDLVGRIPMILDGGSCEVGVESTVVDALVSPPQILRPGGVTLEQIRSTAGWESTVVHRPGVKSAEETPRTPGMKYRHYSPTARIILFESTAAMPDHDFLAKQAILDKKIAFCATRKWPSQLGSSLGSQYLDCPLGADGQGISRKLFSLLRELDDKQVDVILIEGVTDEDEGLAVMNRIRKAASCTIT